MKPLNEILLANAFLLLIGISYELFFKHQRLFQTNRTFLLAGSVLAVVLPFMPWQIGIVNLPMPLVQIDPVVEVPLNGEPFTPDQAGIITPGRSAFQWLLAGYWATVAFLSLVSLGQLVRLLWWARKGRFIRQDGIRIIPLNKPWSAFSFFRNVYYPAPVDLSAPATQTILEHEKVHIRQWHSIDNLIFAAIRILFFYNPAVYLLSNRIRLVHEFIADRAASGSDKAAYSHTLISHQFLVPGMILMHSFNTQSFLKRRLTMLTKNKPMGPAKWNYLLVLPILSLMILISGWSATAQDQAKKSREEIAKTAVEKELTNAGYSKTDIEEIKNRIDGVTVMKVSGHAALPANPNQKAFLIVEKMPVFQGGGIEEYRNWIQSRIKYPEIAKTNGIQGTVYVTFVVDEQGKVINPTVIRSVDPILDQTVLSALKESPDWTPGEQKGEPAAVSFSIPVRFVLDGNKAQKQIASEEASPEESAAMINSYSRDKKYFQIVEVMPVFQGGGIKEFAEWAQARVKYPSIAMENGIHGTVYVAFLVTKEGKVEDVEISRKVDPALDEAVLKVIRSSPDWTPGYQRGKPVHVAFNIPIKFTLQ